MRKSLVFLGLLCLTGCITGHQVIDYDHDVLEPGEYWEEDETDRKHETHLDAKIHKYQKPLDVEDLVKLALEHNPKIKESYYGVMVKDAEKDIAIGEYFPKVSGKAVGGRSRASQTQGNTVSTSQYTEVTPELDLDYLIFDFAGRPSRVAQSKYKYEEASLTYNRLLQYIRQAVASGYWNYLHSKEVVRMQRENVSDYEALLRVIEGKLEAGTSDKGTFLQANAKLLSNKMQLIDVENTSKNLLIKLKAAIGLSPEKELPLENAFPKTRQAEVKYSLANLTDEAMEQRPDLASLRKQKKWAEEGVRNAYTGLLPSISASASYNRPYHINAKNPQYGFTALLSLDIPIFSGFTSVNNVRAWKNQVYNTKASVKAKEVAITEEVAMALNSYEKSEREWKVANELLQTSENSFKVALDKFTAGMIPVVDVITAQSTLSLARIQYVDSLKDWQVAITYLNYYLGKEE